MANPHFREAEEGDVNIFTEARWRQPPLPLIFSVKKKSKRA